VESEEQAPKSALDVFDVSRLPIYCINLVDSVERRARMEQRFAAQSLGDRVHFVTAIDRSSELVDRHLERTGVSSVSDHRRAELGCLLSHARAMRTFLTETPDSVGAAIVMEDDVLLHREWHPRLEAVLGNVPAEAPVCALGHLVDAWPQATWAGIDASERNLVPMVLGRMWGCQAYWMTREHARAALEQFENAPVQDFLTEFGESFVAEFLVWRPAGYVARPPLVVEDALTSTIREDLMFREPGYKVWGVRNYLSTDEDKAQFEPDEPGQTICLCMIVRNESKVFNRLADSVRDLIDTWVICDTGSTDGTPELVQEALAGIPGELFIDEWQDFGTNRTLALERARGKADYLLLLDADQILRVDGLLPHLDADSYGILMDEALTYWVPRLVKGDLPWHYVGSTHEYLDCDEPHRTELLQLLVVEHHADGGSRSDKFERDRRMLEADFAKNPRNARTVFYLAQTYRDLGENELAREFYARRLELGGWPEEMYYSMYCHAELVSRTDWDLGVSLLLEAWEYRPTRVEPLFALTQGFRLRNQFHLGALFGAKGKDLPFPTDILFVHRDHYMWGMAYEWLVCAYNSGDFAGALETSEHLVRVTDLPPDVREYVTGVRRRCRLALGDIHSEQDEDAAVVIRAKTRPLADLVTGCQIGEIRLSVDPQWPQSVPSIAADGDGFKMLIRTTDDTDDATGVPGQAVGSIYYEVEMAPDLVPSDVWPIAGEVGKAGPLGPVATEDIDDCRLVRVGSRWFAVASSRSFGSDGQRRVGLLTLDDGELSDLRVLEGPDAQRDQKNWMPFVLADELYLVYACSPTMVLRCDVDSGLLTTVSQENASLVLREERGGSQGIAVPDGTLFVSHRLTRPDGRALFEHRFLLMDSDTMKFVAASARFRFAEARAEFCAGLALADDHVVLSFGVSDTNAFLARAPYESVRKALWPL
jgi:GR25 family glycosyltransferase involved in LPS biosynthesis/glycosyltransferase involved in cell wall biosynthesis